MSHITANEIMTAANALGIARGARDAGVASATSTGSTRATMQRGSGNISQLMAALRNTAVGLLRGAGHTNIVKACRQMAAQPAKALALVGIEFENGIVLPRTPVPLH